VQAGGDEPEKRGDATIGLFCRLSEASEETVLATDVTLQARKEQLHPQAPAHAGRRRRMWWRDDLKRWVECPLAAIALLALSPLLAAIAIGIKCTTGGPVIYRRRVAGRRGEFDAFKFRTMVQGAERILERDERLREAFTVNWKLFADPRVTKIGRILRKYSLDELPQLFNVVRGEMALIGPRIVSPGELDRYGELGSTLLSVRPGMTGLWQVSGRQTVSYERRIELDMFYIGHCSLAFDISILLRTVPVVLRAEGAY
jgi:lipopolysaccharide/colanic/teichoic acid biosynthesis glycosyltransferase